MKTCTVCKVEKPLEEYNNKKNGKFGKAARCVPCEASYAKAWREANYEVQRAKEKTYKVENREAIRERSRAKYRSIPVEMRQQKSKIKKEKYREAYRVGKKKYRSRPEIKQRDRDYVNKKYKQDPQFRLARVLRNRYAKCRWSHKMEKVGSTVKDLGCTIPEFKEYLESKFEDWMNWENHGKYDPNRKTWNIDHIIPLCKFDLTKREEFLKAAYYTNLQPMDAIKNLRKNRF